VQFLRGRRRRAGRGALIDAIGSSNHAFRQRRRNRCGHRHPCRCHDLAAGMFAQGWMSFESEGVQFRGRRRVALRRQGPYECRARGAVGMMKGDLGMMKRSRFSFLSSGGGRTQKEVRLHGRVRTGEMAPYPKVLASVAKRPPIPGGSENDVLRGPVACFSFLFY